MSKQQLSSHQLAFAKQLAETRSCAGARSVIACGRWLANKLGCVFLCNWTAAAAVSACGVAVGCGLGKPKRDRAIQKVRKWAEHQFSIADLELRKLWESLFYCLYMSDKRMIQAECAQMIASLIHDFPADVGVRFFAAGVHVLCLHWHTIDANRYDKFLRLVRMLISETLRHLSRWSWSQDRVEAFNSIMRKLLVRGAADLLAYEQAAGLRTHAVSVLVDELVLLSEINALPVSHSTVIHLLQPVLQMLSGESNAGVVAMLMRDVFEALLNYKNECEREREAVAELERDPSLVETFKPRQFRSGSVEVDIDALGDAVFAVGASVQAVRVARDACYAFKKRCVRQAHSSSTREFAKLRSHRAGASARAAESAPDDADSSDQAVAHIGHKRPRYQADNSKHDEPLAKRPALTVHHRKENEDEDADADADAADTSLASAYAGKTSNGPSMMPVRTPERGWKFDDADDDNNANSSNARDDETNKAAAAESDDESTSLSGVIEEENPDAALALKQKRRLASVLDRKISELQSGHLNEIESLVQTGQDAGKFNWDEEDATSTFAAALQTASGSSAAEIEALRRKLARKERNEMRAAKKAQRKALPGDDSVVDFMAEEVDAQANKRQRKKKRQPKHQGEPEKMIDEDDGPKKLSAGSLRRARRRAAKAAAKAAAEGKPLPMRRVAAAVAAATPTRTQQARRRSVQFDFGANKCHVFSWRKPVNEQATAKSVPNPDAQNLPAKSLLRRRDSA